jgi:ATP-dependent helicase HrpB
VVVVAEPPRLARRPAAARMAALVGEEVGRTVGYAARGDSHTSAATRDPSTGDDVAVPRSTG